MTLEEYIVQAKEELDKMAENYMKYHEKNPDRWPLDRAEGDWGEEELLTRF